MVKLVVKVTNGPFLLSAGGSGAPLWFGVCRFVRVSAMLVSLLLLVAVRALAPRAMSLLFSHPLFSALLVVASALPFVGSVFPPVSVVVTVVVAVTLAPILGPVPAVVGRTVAVFLLNLEV